MAPALAAGQAEGADHHGALDPVGGEAKKAATTVPQRRAISAMAASELSRETTTTAAVSLRQETAASKWASGAVRGRETGGPVWSVMAILQVFVPPFQQLSKTGGG